MHSAILLVGLITALGCFGPLAAPADAQQFPAKLVKFVVPQAPGGATDVFARKIGQILSEQWGQPIIIENRAGAGGVVGTDVVAKSPPDGYTLLVTYAGSQAINASLYPKLPFDTIKDFQTVATLAVTPFVLIVSPKASGQQPCGVHCAGEGQARRFDLRIFRQRFSQPSSRRDAQG
jgi:tripartite-type tricarboxylate transporter receptor subunit TctC